MKINVIPDKPVIKEPKAGYIYRHRARLGFWLGVTHPQIANRRVVLVSLDSFTSWWSSSGHGGFGDADPTDFEEVGKLTVEK